MLEIQLLAAGHSGVTVPRQSTLMRVDTTLVVPEYS